MKTVSDREEFAGWVSPHLAAMARLAARLAPDADRDDVVQEALVRAWLKRHQFDPQRGTPSARLLAITADQAGKARSRASRRLAPVPNEPASANHDDDLHLRQALDRLTDRQRLAVDCVHYVGLTVTETAAVMRCAEGTVKSTLADARAELRVLLEVAE
ncbi:RNA polymerase sigma factor [Lentzea alba]|uniref:RNA polymerase sigma factor n=1 Tax=Lentzea alba TaxID=2714351 RepID=UPI0039BF49E8